MSEHNGNGKPPKPLKHPLPRLAFSAMEAPLVLGVSYHYFNEHIAGELHWVRRGSKKLVSHAELQRWLDDNGAPIFGN